MENKTEEQPEKIFPPTVKITPCAQNTCLNDHHWPAQLVIVQCPGCGSQAVAARMMNCPVCNEPQKALRFRLDHVTDGNGVLPVCRGVKGFHNHAFIDLNFHHSEVAMENYNADTGKVELPKENANGG